VISSVGSVKREEICADTLKDAVVGRGGERGKGGG